MTEGERAIAAPPGATERAVAEPGDTVARRQRRGTARLLSIASVLTLIGLALMAWSMLQPTWMPVMVAMSFGQLIGSAAFAIYLFVVGRELRRSLRAAGGAPP